MKKNWTPDEDDELKSLLKVGTTVEVISNSLNRTTDAVRNRMKRLKISRTAETSRIITPDKIVDYDEIARLTKINLFKAKPYKQCWTGPIQEEAVLVLSDIHAGMINSIYDPNTHREMETYNEKIRQKEQIYLRDSVFQISDLFSKSYKIKKLHIFMLGDMVTNDRIFTGQTFEIEQPVGIQIWSMVRDLTHLIEEMKEKFEEIDVIGVVGNHGRTTDKYQEEPVENNFEYHLYKIIQQVFINDPRVKVTVPNTRFFSTEIMGHTYYMSHGDSMRGVTRNSIDKAMREMLTALIPDLPQGFDVYLMGHFHKSEKMDLNEKSTLLINGCWIPRDCYGFKMFRQYSKPGQWLFGVGKQRSITWSFNLDFGNPYSKLGS